MNAPAQTFAGTTQSGFSNRANPFLDRNRRTNQGNSSMMARDVAATWVHDFVPARNQIRELDTVCLLADVATADGVLFSGTEGTVVYRYRDGAAFEIEFDSPFHALLTLRSGEVARLRG